MKENSIVETVKWLCIVLTMCIILYAIFELKEVKKENRELKEYIKTLKTK